MAFATSAMALGPVSPTAPTGLGNNVVKAQYVVKKKIVKRPMVRKKVIVRKQMYVPGSRHAHAPRGWHRYGSRPGDWRTRGCVVVGPVWFCP
jgi:hypothetical protein